MSFAGAVANLLAKAMHPDSLDRHFQSTALGDASITPCGIWLRLKAAPPWSLQPIQFMHNSEAEPFMPMSYKQNAHPDMKVTLEMRIIIS